MSDQSRLTKVQQRLLNEVLAYRDGMSNETAATESGGHRNKASAGDLALQYGGHRGWRSWLKRPSLGGIVVAACVAALVFVLVGTGSGSRVLAATPPPLVYHADSAQSGRAVLLHLAAVAARQPVPSSPASGRFAYVKYAGWYLDVRVSGATATSTFPPPVVSEAWTRPDGYGRVIRRRATGGPRVTGSTRGPIVEDFTVPSGVGHAYPLLHLSTDPTVVARQLNAGDPPKWREPAWRFDLLTNLNMEQPVPSNVESTILRVLATSPGLINSGAVVDRAGRPGVAVSLDSRNPPGVSGPRERYTLIFSPSTGRLLGEEDTLIGNPGKLDVRRGAVLDYTVYLSSRYVDSGPPRP
jgi:hypothetical protein